MCARRTLPGNRPQAATNLPWTEGPESAARLLDPLAVEVKHAGHARLSEGRAETFAQTACGLVILITWKPNERAAVARRSQQFPRRGTCLKRASLAISAS